MNESLREISEIIRSEKSWKPSSERPDSFVCEAVEWATAEYYPDLDESTVTVFFEGISNVEVDEVLSFFGISSAEFELMPHLPPKYTDVFSGFELALAEFTIGGSLKFLSDVGRIKSVSFRVIAANEQRICDKISIRPAADITVLSPADNGAVWGIFRGEFKAGSSSYELAYNLFTDELNFQLKAGEKLDLQAILATFITAPLPQLTFDRLSAKMNASKGEYVFSLGASTDWGFSILNKDFAITHIQLEAAQRGSRFNIFFQGEFLFIGTPLRVECCYSAGNYLLAAQSHKIADLKLAEFAKEFLQTAALPEKFLDFKIKSIILSYNKTPKNDNSFYFHAELDNLLEITDRFKISTFIIETTFRNGGLQALNLTADFVLLSCAFLLNIQKGDTGITYSGGTVGLQSIPILTVITELLRDLLGFSVTLPEGLNAFVISRIGFCYLEPSTDGASFSFGCTAAFTGQNTVLKNIFATAASVDISAKKAGSAWVYSFVISCALTIRQSHIISCVYVYDKQSTGALITLTYAAAGNSAVTLGDIFAKLGISNIDAESRFLTAIGISSAEISYDILGDRFAGRLKLTSGGTVSVNVEMGASFSYSIKIASTMQLSLYDVPVAGGLVKKLAPNANLSVSGLVFYALSKAEVQDGKTLPAGVRLDFKLFGEVCSWQITQLAGRRSAAATANIADTYGAQAALVAADTAAVSSASAAKAIWFKTDKTIAIFTLHRLGLGLDGTYLMFLLDGSLNVSPLTFTLYGAGIGVDISDFAVKFYLSGFGVSFDNSVLKIGGELVKNGDAYAGSLLIQIKQISIFAVAEYSTGGDLFAYAVLSAKIGGPPAFFITGLALGFGYNKRVIIPQIENVSEFPLIKAAMGRISNGEMLTELKSRIVSDKGQKFLAVGVRVTSFEIVESFVLLTVTFGNNFEVDLLGISTVTMPPSCPSGVTPLARATLALKASVRPAEGFLGVEARLTSDSYILSTDCHLTGGFAFYTWFSGPRTGDFVITLGGYHPAYVKPAHYPDAPRVGFNWNIGSAVNINGEMYFALTPSCVMAGGRLSLTYTLGCLRAYFIAKLDLFMSWKPFHYDVAVSVVIGASVRIKVWFISFALKIEVGAALHIWGPDFTGTARVNLAIFSFTVSFGAGASKAAPPLDWTEFCASFLPQRAKAARLDSARSETLKISFADGLTGKLSVNGSESSCVCADGSVIYVESVLPLSSAEFNGSPAAIKPVPVSVKPMGNVAFSSKLSVTIAGAAGKAKFTAEPLKRNLPTALWGGSGELLAEVPCGLILRSQAAPVKLFPEKLWVSLAELYRKSTKKIRNAFDFTTAPNVSYSCENTIQRFAATANSDSVCRKRTSFLESLGVSLAGVDVSVKKLAADADSFFDDEVLIAK